MNWQWMHTVRRSVQGLIDASRFPSQIENVLCSLLTLPPQPCLFVAFSTIHVGGGFLVGQFRSEAGLPDVESSLPTRSAGRVHSSTYGIDNAGLRKRSGHRLTNVRDALSVLPSLTRDTGKQPQSTSGSYSRSTTAPIRRYIRRTGNTATQQTMIFDCNWPRTDQTDFE